MDAKQERTTKLRFWDAKHAACVVGWADSPEVLWHWAARRDFPLSPTVFAQWHADSDVTAYELLLKDELAGYGELWHEQSEAEIGRLIIAPQLRRRGLGLAFVRQLGEEAGRLGVDGVWVRVLPTNGVAMACYRRAGFARASQEHEQAFNTGQPAQFVWMRSMSAR